MSSEYEYETSESEEEEYETNSEEGENDDIVKEQIVKIEKFLEKEGIIEEMNEEDEQEEDEENEEIEDEEDEEEEEEDEEEEEEDDESEGESSSGGFVVTKKTKIELVKEKEVFKKLCQISIPTGEESLKNYFYDLSTVLFRFIEKEVVFSLEQEVIEKFYRKICFYLVTLKSTHEEKSIVKSVRDDLSFDITKTIMIALSYLSSIRYFENFEYNEIPTLFDLRFSMIKLRRNSLYFINNQKIKEELLKTIYHCFYYISRIGYLDDEEDAENWNVPLFQKVNETEEGEKYYSVSDYFIKFSEVFFYHMTRSLLLQTERFYYDKKKIIMPPFENIKRFVNSTDSFLRTITQKEIMDRIMCQNIPVWLEIEMETDFHMIIKNLIHKPPPLVILSLYRKPDVAKFATFIKTYNGLVKWWQTINVDSLFTYYKLDDETYNPVYEEATREIFQHYLEENLGLNIEKVIVKKNNIALPLELNSFYNSKYPRIIQTVKGYCLFDPFIKKLIPYKTFIVTFYMWIFTISQKLFIENQFISSDLIDKEIEKSIPRIIFFVRNSHKQFFE